MLENIQAYLSKQGVKYIKPEKAGPHQEEMESLKSLGQAARKEMRDFSKLLEARFGTTKMDCVSNWANQAPIINPHLVLLQGPEDGLGRCCYGVRLCNLWSAWKMGGFQ